MKNLVHLKLLSIIFFTALLLNSCDLSGTDENLELNTSIVDLIKAEPNLSSLLAALEANPSNNILTSLSNPGSYTLLAPTNEAFDEFLNGAQLTDLSASDLEQLLLNHILIDNVDEDAFEVANDQDLFYTKTAAFIIRNNERLFLNIYFNTSNNELKFNNLATVIDGDKTADNGIIHTVDKVIDLPTVVTFVQADERLSTLLGALTSDGQPDFATILSTPLATSPAPFTVFAPINSAFSALASVPTGDDLTQVLLHHVIPEANIVSSQITNGLVSPATLEGDVLTFTVQNNIGFIEDGAGNNDAKLITGNLNIQAKNGVVHAIDKVLIPNTGN
ncbi:MAG: fasciclin domain-containing protein [Cellulophaga sp.]|nr:fasciclin domain-containing protein [Cellulophaga sp.]